MAKSRIQGVQKENKGNVSRIKFCKQNVNYITIIFPLPNPCAINNC